MDFRTVKPSEFTKKLYEFEKNVAEHLEIMAAAYLKETNIPIEECELVVENSLHKTIYHFQRRKAAQHSVHADEGGVWFCTTCANTNPEDWKKCVRCDTPRPRG
jgi:hypothetical protein